MTPAKCLKLGIKQRPPKRPKPRAAGRLRPGDRVWVDMPNGEERTGALVSQGKDSGGEWAVVRIDGRFSVSSPDGELVDAKNVRKMPLGQ